MANPLHVPVRIVSSHRLQFPKQVQSIQIMHATDPKIETARIVIVAKLPVSRIEIFCDQSSSSRPA
jgi:hypothetical protein